MKADNPAIGGILAAIPKSGLRCGDGRFRSYPQEFARRNASQESRAIFSVRRSTK